MSFQLRSPGALPGHKDLELLAEASFTDTRSALDMQLGFPRKGFEVQLSPTDQTEEYAQYLGGVIVNNTQLNNEEKTAIGKVAKAIQMTGLGLLQIDENLTQRHYESLNAIAVLESGRLDYELFDLLSD
jgi:hypothetical protein